MPQEIFVQYLANAVLSGFEMVEGLYVKLEETL
jgi:hypothetical protein